jgi:hypothetical protein
MPSNCSKVNQPNDQFAPDVYGSVTLLALVAGHTRCDGGTETGPRPRDIRSAVRYRKSAGSSMSRHVRGRPLRVRPGSSPSGGPSLAREGTPWARIACLTPGGEHRVLWNDQGIVVCACCHIPFPGSDTWAWERWEEITPEIVLAIIRQCGRVDLSLLQIPSVGRYSGVAPSSM